MIVEYIKSILLGIIEGITEWLPISSTGHMILFNEFTNTKSGFLTSDVFLYVIQLGAILAIVTLFFKKLNPFSPSKTREEKANTWQMWFKVVVACVPAAVIGLLFNDFMEKFENPFVISAALILYGIFFILIENNQRKTITSDIDKLSYKTAVLIGMFQVLSIVPGTSRSGSTILGAMLLGCSREVAAEFSFFLAIPVMFGVSVLKLATNDYIMTSSEWGILIVGMAVAYVVSLIAVKFLMDYVRKHDFKAFGIYRIVLGIIVIAYFTLRSLTIAL